MAELAGPGAITENEIRPDPTLQGATQYEFVTIYNPLTVDFAIKVAQTRPVDVPITVSNPADSGRTRLPESEVTRLYGVGLKNPDYASKTHITNNAIIKSGGTINLTGDVAQVAVRQLVNEIMQREGNALKIADPTARKEVEDRIVKRRGSMDELMDSRLQSQQDQLNQAIEKSNEVTHEEAFPDLNAVKDGAGAPGEVESGDSSKSSGRKKTD